MEFRAILRVPQLAVPRVPSVESLLSGKYQASISEPPELVIAAVMKMMLGRVIRKGKER
jgi:hypothetical protein